MALLFRTSVHGLAVIAGPGATPLSASAQNGASFQFGPGPATFSIAIPNIGTWPGNVATFLDGVRLLFMTQDGSAIQAIEVYDGRRKLAGWGPPGQEPQPMHPPVSGDCSNFNSAWFGNIGAAQQCYGLAMAITVMSPIPVAGQPGLHGVITFYGAGGDWHEG